MEVQMFLTHVPQQGQFGPWMSLDRHGHHATALSVTAFRPDRTDRKELLPIWGEIEWRETSLDQARLKRFNGGMVDVVLPSDTPPPRIRFKGEGAAGGDLRVVLQFRDIATA